MCGGAGGVLQKSGAGLWQSTVSQICVLAGVQNPDIYGTPVQSVAVPATERALGGVGCRPGTDHV
jgi:hypothetical protein